MVEMPKLSNIEVRVNKTGEPKFDEEMIRRAATIQHAYDNDNVIVLRAEEEEGDGYHTMLCIMNTTETEDGKVIMGFIPVAKLMMNTDQEFIGSLKQPEINKREDA